MRRDYSFDRIVGGVALYAVILLGGFFMFKQDHRAYFMNLFTDVLGIIITVFILDTLAERREERRNQWELKEQLIRDFRSSVHEIAIHAAEELKAHGWLTDGSLQGIWLRGANLYKADLNDADLRKADLGFADLRKAFLAGRGANLQGAVLMYANLEGANLGAANLREAILEHAVLCGAHMWGVSLQGANLQGANLLNADLGEANLTHPFVVRIDEKTTLPDGSNGAPDTDLSRFTNPNHPRFWPTEAAPDSSPSAYY